MDLQTNGSVMVRVLRDQYIHSIEISRHEVKSYSDDWNKFLAEINFNISAPTDWYIETLTFHHYGRVV